MNFLAQDCPNLQFPAMEVCRDMSFPTVASWARLKRLARYLVTRKAVIFQYEWQDEGKLMTLYTDSDWAGCRRTRKSTSGGAVLIGTHCVKTWSCTQGPIALSSAEAEYYTMVEETIKAEGVQTVAREIGLLLDSNVPISLFTDSSAAKSFVSRRGLGRMRHVATRELWLQEEVLSRRLVVNKVHGAVNPADLLTKFLSHQTISRHLKALSISVACF